MIRPCGRGAATVATFVDPGVENRILADLHDAAQNAANIRIFRHVWSTWQHTRTLHEAWANANPASLSSLEYAAVNDAFAAQLLKA